jgi:hypothetical protein
LRDVGIEATSLLGLGSKKEVSVLPRISLLTRRPDYLSKEEWRLFGLTSDCSWDGLTPRQIARKLGVPVREIDRLYEKIEHGEARRDKIARFQENRIDTREYAHC